MQYLKRDHSSKLVLLFQAKVSIPGNSNIIHKHSENINFEETSNIVSILHEQGFVDPQFGTTVNAARLKPKGEQKNFFRTLMAQKFKAT